MSQPPLQTGQSSWVEGVIARRHDDQPSAAVLRGRTGAAIVGWIRWREGLPQYGCSPSTSAFLSGEWHCASHTTTNLPRRCSAGELERPSRDGSAVAKGCHSPPSTSAFLVSRVALRHFDMEIDVNTDVNMTANMTSVSSKLT